MRTNKSITFAALNSHYLDTSDMTINAEYLNDAIIIWGSNTQKFYREYTQTRRKITAIVWAMFEDLTNDHIKTDEYPYNQDCYSTSYQLKQWLNTYGNGYKTLKPAIDYFEAERKEFKED